MEKSVFQKHPSKLLNKLYVKKNHQGAHPKDAKIFFIGRDPNWAINVENMAMFKYIQEYLNDGISFWNKYEIHHPFLLPDYKGDGKRYHTIFSKLKINRAASSEISFLELIGFPTTGMAKSNTKVFNNYLLSEENKNHLIELDFFLSDSTKTIFVAWGLVEDFKMIHAKTGLFKKFAEIDKSKMLITDLNQFGNIFVHRHFSDAISNTTIEKIENKLKEILN
ncbi:hypothetical protein [Flavobacterium sp. GNP001]